MKNFISITFALGVIFVFLSCATSDKKLPEPEGVLLSQSELEKIHSEERTYTLKTNKSLVEITETCFPNGTNKYTWRSGEEQGGDTGTYRIINGQKCTSYKSINKGKERCWKVYKMSDDKYYIECTDGSEFGYVTRK